MKNSPNAAEEWVTFGPVHLRNTDLTKAQDFWTRIVGLEVLDSTDRSVSLGTPSSPLVVVHGTATRPHHPAYTGMYHVAIHHPTPGDFASQVHRLVTQNYPFSPVDHTMSQSLYVEDSDGLSIELTFETPERFGSVTTEYGGMHIVDSQGRVKPASAPLDLEAVLAHLPDGDRTKAASETKIGHVHLAVSDVEEAHRFFQRLGLAPFNVFPQLRYTDLGTGSAYQHRIALNSWKTTGRPPLPEGWAGMDHFEMVYRSQAEWQTAVRAVPHRLEGPRAWVTAPSGTPLLLSFLIP